MKYRGVLRESMPPTFRVVLRSTETQPSRETQESVLPALSQKFGQRADVTAADIAPDERLGAARVGTVEVADADALADVYEYLKPNRLVKISTIETDDGATVVTRKAHLVDQESLERREDAALLGAVHGDVLVRVRRDDDA